MIQPTSPPAGREIPWKENAAYLAALKTYLEPVEGTAFHNGLFFAFTDILRFDGMIEAIARYTPLAGKSILDSGCGAGGLCLRLLKYDPEQITGIELDPVVAQMAKLRIGATRQIDILHEDGSIAGLSDNTFDVVFSIHVIEHVANHVQYLNELYRLLKPGGFLYLACPNRVWPFEAHSQLPFIHYLPRPLAKRVANRVARMAFVSGPLRQSLRTSELYEHDFTHVALKSLLMRSRFAILEQNHPRYFHGELINVSMLGALMSRLSLRQQWYFSALFSRSLIAICQKVD